MPSFFQQFLVSIAYVLGIVNIKVNSDLSSKIIGLNAKTKTDALTRLHVHPLVKREETSTMVDVC